LMTAFCDYPIVSSPPKRSAERGPPRTLRHKVPDRLTPSGMTAFLRLTNRVIPAEAKRRAGTPKDYAAQGPR
jgi:hypothetical protein